MAVTATYTALDAVQQSLRAAGVLAIGETAPADEAEHGRVSLNRMLKAWQAREKLEWTLTTLSHTMTTAAAQTLDPIRPLRVQQVNFRRNGIDLPMQMLNRDEYDELPQKTSTGTPTTFFYDRQREAARLYVWPVLATAAGETLEITYERELEDIAALSDTLDVPGEAWDAVVINLAFILARDFGSPRQDLKSEADRLWNDLLAGQNDGSFWFGEAEY